MTKSIKSIVLLVLAATFMFTANAHAGVTLAAARIGAKDVEGVAKFYKSAFGMQEIIMIVGFAEDPASNSIELIQLNEN